MSSSLLSLALLSQTFFYHIVILVIVLLSFFPELHAVNILSFLFFLSSIFFVASRLCVALLSHLLSTVQSCLSRYHSFVTNDSPQGRQELTITLMLTIYIYLFLLTQSGLVCSPVWHDQQTHTHTHKNEVTTTKHKLLYYIYLHTGTLYCYVSQYSVQYVWRHTWWGCEIKLNSITSLRYDRYFMCQLNYDAAIQIITLLMEPMKDKFNSIICRCPCLTSTLYRVVTATLWPLYTWEQAPWPNCTVRWEDCRDGLESCGGKKKILDPRGATENVITYCLYVRPT